VTRIWVDADSCPVKAEVYRAARRRDLPVTVVAARPFSSPGWVTLEVPARPGRPDAADDHIVAGLAAGDVVVTDDRRLARRCLLRGGRTLTTRGRLVEGGVEGRSGPVGGPPPFRRRDRVRFRRTLASLLDRPSPTAVRVPQVLETATRFRPPFLAS
jgi:hypothetical protein